MSFPPGPMFNQFAFDRPIQKVVIGANTANNVQIFSGKGRLYNIVVTSTGSAQSNFFDTTLAVVGNNGAAPAGTAQVGVIASGAAIQVWPHNSECDNGCVYIGNGANPAMTVYFTQGT